MTLLFLHHPDVLGRRQQDRLVSELGLGICSVVVGGHHFAIASVACTHAGVKIYQLY